MSGESDGVRPNVSGSRLWAPAAALAAALMVAGGAWSFSGGPGLLASVWSAQTEVADAAPADQLIRITWADLSPPPETEEEQRAVEEMAAALSGFLGGAMLGPESYGDGPGPGFVPHGTSAGFVLDGNRLVEAYDDKRVSMAGYLLPLDFSENGSTEFLLVPFIGACIHVPPPPPNQLVLLRTEKPHRPKGIFEAVTVTGIFNRYQAETELAESGYKIDVDAIASFE